jgi:hypothetical protein
VPTAEGREKASVSFSDPDPEWAERERDQARGLGQPKLAGRPRGTAEPLMAVGVEAVVASYVHANTIAAVRPVSAYSNSTAPIRLDRKTRSDSRLHRHRSNNFHLPARSGRSQHTFQ